MDAAQKLPRRRVLTTTWPAATMTLVMSPTAGYDKRSTGQYGWAIRSIHAPLLALPAAEKWVINNEFSETQTRHSMEKSLVLCRPAPQEHSFRTDGGALQGSSKPHVQTCFGPPDIVVIVKPICRIPLIENDLPAYMAFDHWSRHARA